MDPNTLAAALSATLSSDNAINTAAAASLRKLEGQSGFAVMLLRVAEAPMIDLSTRQAASTFFKNFVKRQWVRICDKWCDSYLCLACNL